MASIINSLSFKNFFNYYGDYNNVKYEFKEGVNIIVADNGAGKSKFFNAFLWLFYDDVLDSDDKKRKSVKDFAFKIISDKAKSETAIGEKVETGIKIEYSTGRYKFQIVKSFIATRIGEKISDSENWQIIMNDIEIDKTDHIIHRYKPVYDTDEKRRIINQLILPDLRQYSFFQGEEVDKMIDFTKKSSIEDAVRTLTNISKYEEIATIVEYIEGKAYKDLNKQTKEKDAHSDRLDEAMKVRDELKESITQEEEKLEIQKSLYTRAQEEYDQLDANYSNASKRKDLDEKISDKNKKLRTANEEYQRFLEGINNRFFDGNFSWITLGFEGAVDDFKNKISVFREKRYEKRALLNAAENPNDYFTILPSNSPDAVTLQQMIDKEHCYVCDREAPEGSDAHNYLLKLKNRPNQTDNKKDFVKNNLEDFFSGLQVNASPFLNKFDSILPSVSRTMEKEVELKNRLQKISDQVKSLKSQRKDLIITTNQDEDTDPSKIISQYKGASKRIADADLQISRINNKLKILKSDLKKTEKEINDLRPKDIPEGYSKNHEIIQDLLEATSKARERVFDKMVTLLENHANEHFLNLIKYNDIKGGVLNFEKSPSGGISLDYIDEAGNEVSGASEGFQRMKKFAVVMAIISANTSNYNYPLLADAPLSAFGKAFNKGFFEAIPNVFPQSIILVKDLYDKDSNSKLTDLGNKLVNDKNIRTFYLNEVDGDLSQIERTTRIERRK